jgi:hypothetical protein
MTLYAVGLADQPPRIIIDADEDTALAQAQGAEVVVEVGAVGDLKIAANGLSASARTKSLTELKDEKWLAVKALEAVKAAEPVAVSGIGTVDADERSKGFLTGLAATAVFDSGYSISLTLANNSQATVDSTDIQTINAAVTSRVVAVHDHAQTLRASIYAAANTSALNAIDITTGWPT